MPQCLTAYFSNSEDMTVRLIWFYIVVRRAFPVVRTAAGRRRIKRRTLQTSRPQSPKLIIFPKTAYSGLYLLGQFCEFVGGNGLFGHLDLALHILDHLRFVEFLVDLLRLLLVGENLLLGEVFEHLVRCGRHSVLRELCGGESLRFGERLVGRYGEVVLLDEVLLNVVAAKKLLESKRAVTVQEAADAVGISRSSFYKYKDDIFPFHEEAKGKTITFIIQMDDEPGILSNVLRAIAENHGNILTIHQSIPISGIATLTLSVQILQGEGDAEAMVDDIEQMEGIHYLKILGRE